jgi:hypothetical protein
MAGLPVIDHGSRADSGGPGDDERFEFYSVPGVAGCVLYESAAGVGCRHSTDEESLTLAAKDSYGLSLISPVRLQEQGGLKIMLRAAPQLESFPEAKAAFLRAAALWESVIQTPVTIVVDVDFGPTWFGQQFPDGVIGLTNPQVLVADPIYRTLHRRYLNRARSEKELELYASLPLQVVPTDSGDTGIVAAPSALFRALGFIPEVADPEIEPSHWGPPPAIGFNSAIEFDFDARDGVDEGKADFESVVAHELGHALGFVSVTGRHEMDPNFPVAVSVWDLFRVRPGGSMSSFSTSDRLLKAGGVHAFYTGGSEHQLSTGRPDGSGGDGRQASHWKDDALVGPRVGIMDPTLPRGRRYSVTLDDLTALDWFGYDVRPVGDNKPGLSELSASLLGDVLTVSGTVADADGDAVRAQVKLLDQKGRVLGETAPFSVQFGVGSAEPFSVELSDMSRFAEAVAISFTVIDSKDNRSNVEEADFSGADPGGPKLSSVSFKRDKLTVKGKRFAGSIRLEINGTFVGESSSLQANGSGKKLVVSASSQELNLRQGANRVRVICDGLRSNILVVNM